ncbi:MAG: hypothetical protein IJU82_03650 [Ruminiclostridium sp.]|nr:hypothetical protein [Ruminiclostridium sp.]
MDNDTVREYLGLLMAAVADSTTGAEIVESEDGPFLICSVKSPFGDAEDICYQFSVTQADEGLVAFEALIFLFSSINSDKFAGVNAITAAIDPHLTLGSLRLFEEGGSVIFAQGMIFDETQDLGTVTSVLGKTVGLMENAAVNAGGYIRRYLNGEKLETLLDEISKEG